MKPLYLALSGGGAHAAAHAGVLQALDREGVLVGGDRRGERGGARGGGVGGRGRPRPARGPGLSPPPVDVGARLGRGAPLREPPRRVDRRVPAHGHVRGPSRAGRRPRHRRRHRRGRRLPRGQPPRRRPRLVQLPRRLPALRLERPAARRRGSDRGRSGAPRPRDGGRAGGRPRHRLQRRRPVARRRHLHLDRAPGRAHPHPGAYPLRARRGRLVIAPAIGESGWMRPTRIPSFAAAGGEALVAGLPELRRLLGA